MSDWISCSQLFEFGVFETLRADKPLVFKSKAHMNKCKSWIISKSNQEIFVHAWLDGYEVDKEPTIHDLKILPTYFEDVIVGKKTFEIRKNDRNYKVGDILILNEYTCVSLTGRKCKVMVNYITDYKQKESYVVLGIIRFNRPEDVRESRS